MKRIQKTAKDRRKMSIYQKIKDVKELKFRLT